MKNYNYIRKKKVINIERLLPLIIVLPPVLIGAITMYFNNVPAVIWGQNIGVALVGGIVSYFILRKKHNCNNIYVLWISIILLFFTYFNIGLEGVHRWISIGPIKLYVSSIVMPILIIVIHKLINNKSVSSYIAIGLASVIMFIQPDASQLTGFSVAIIIILLSKLRKKLITYILISIMIILSVFLWINLDTLKPVDYVENIIFMVTDLGYLWIILCFISLIMLIIPFILFPPRNFRVLSITIGIYYLVILGSTFFGNFPVPLMGYGISPIIGYYISITWLINARHNCRSIFT